MSRIFPKYVPPVIKPVVAPVKKEYVQKAVPAEPSTTLRNSHNAIRMADVMTEPQSKQTAENKSDPEDADMQLANSMCYFIKGLRGMLQMVGDNAGQHRPF